MTWFLGNRIYVYFTDARFTTAPSPHTQNRKTAHTSRKMYTRFCCMLSWFGYIFVSGGFIWFIHPYALELYHWAIRWLLTGRLPVQQTRRTWVSNLHESVKYISINSLRPSDAIWRHISGSTLVQVMACCLMAPSHYLSLCSLIISKIQLLSSDGNFTRDTSVIND